MNAAGAAPWRAPPLAFVAGLGPRKAQALLRAVVREKGAQARADLWRRPNDPEQPPLAIFGRCVFRCACCLWHRDAVQAPGTSQKQQSCGTAVIALVPRHLQVAKRRVMDKFVNLIS